MTHMNRRLLYPQWLNLLVLAMLMPLGEMTRPLDTYATVGHASCGASCEVNTRPIIGILTLPGDMAGRGQSYISAGYVKWLESAGARVMPLLYDLEDEELERRFNMINGILITGGNYPLRPGTRWHHAAHLLFNLTLQANKRGNHFPMHGTCLGMQLLATFLTHDEYALSSVDAHDHPAPLELVPGSEASAWFRGMPAEPLRNLQTQPIVMHNHFYGLLPDVPSRYPDFGSFYRVLSYTTDKQGVRYISTFEARDYPITGIAYHPEKVSFEWTTEVHIPHTHAALDVAYHMAQALVSEARRNTQQAGSAVKEDRYLIYNWLPQFSGRHEHEDDPAFFEQIYLFDAEDLPDKRTSKLPSVSTRHRKNT